VAFVRQRRDTANPDLDFSDLDRERRQQAFIASLAYQLRQAGTLANPWQLSAIIEVAKQNIATDTTFDLLGLAPQAATLTGGNITFTTLPITGFGTDPLGEDVNLVDIAQVQALVRDLLNPPPPTNTAAANSAPTNTGGPPATSAPSVSDSISGGTIPCVK
jgi:anionic cell wall polymer biosynthesis LytR-Cps2A-Psr (LCP) family protein